MGCRWLSYSLHVTSKAGEWIRINQLGYLPQSVKVAVFMSEEETNIENFFL